MQSARFDTKLRYESLRYLINQEIKFIGRLDDVDYLNIYDLNN